MGASSSKGGVPVVWGATTHRGKKEGKQKKEYTEDQLKKLNVYLQQQIVQLRAHMKQLRESETGWQEEFGIISKVGLGTRASASAALENTTKNRYRNIVAYDHSRVKITPAKHNFHNDYVNANFVDGYYKKNAYIASQGPVPDAFPNFWQMVWEQDVNMIVMVASEVEAGRLKCHRYWPELNQTATYGVFEVTTIKEQATRNNIHRTFRLKNLETEQHDRVEHLQFILWPDHGVPNTSGEILAFREDVYRLHDPNTPLIVHCSAGVGRTGTYIAIDRLICAAESLAPTLSVVDIVSDLRRTRNFMVQTVIQYGFVYLSLHEALVKGHKQVQLGLAKLDQLTREQMQGELDEITEDIDEVLEEVQAYGNDRVTQQVSELRQRTEGGRADESRVSVVKRMEAFMSAAKEPTPRARTAPAVDADWEGLQSRIKTLADQAADAFQQQYRSAESAWQQEGEYSVGTELTPIESRVAAFTSQEEAWKIRGPEFRKQIEDDSLRELASLQARVENFNDALRDAEHKFLKRRQSSQAQLQSDFDDMQTTSLVDRMMALATPNAKGSSFGRVLAKPISSSRIQKGQARSRHSSTSSSPRMLSLNGSCSSLVGSGSGTPRSGRRSTSGGGLGSHGSSHEQLPPTDEKRAMATPPRAHGEVVETTEPEAFFALRASAPKQEAVHPMVAQMARTRSDDHVKAKNKKQQKKKLSKKWRFSRKASKGSKQLDQPQDEQEEEHEAGDGHGKE
ncbi:hypothetical protein PTSG_10488 [Salpingoeca rosetta]|uniref:protein-tyrosine-phosphatase n=1 Tax=Salpingoeca rosetta (strain ATCC 50818 / BSB-021) TaxID=946362 RepID=F2UPT6_SALR5|nr:uncharacterized protein PTSG_10488 [Salpingoeca rosetta]EGD79641.1 hypothetical protein PTSG_10488 [Salpingoeca rosetta]|eukprot:XP_004988869.1 hypothetical protein PTSG_10488 [Salpingoeca rosetta]